MKQFGRIDVVCNNAGYGLSGEFESVTEEQSRKQMEVNFFGLLKVTRRALKIMREVNKPVGGKIQQITSIGGQRGVPTFSIYCASKWAVEGFTEALSKELKPEWYVEMINLASPESVCGFVKLLMEGRNIKLTCIEPGGFRTDWAGRSMEFGANKEAAYDSVFETVTVETDLLMQLRPHQRRGDDGQAQRHASRRSSEGTSFSGTLAIFSLV